MRKPISGRFPILLGSALMLTGLFVSAPVRAQLSGGGGDRIEGRAKFIPVPYIGYSRSIGFTLGALPLLMFNPSTQDTISPSSIAGALGMYTTNKTWFAMGFTKLYLAADTWRVTAAGGSGSINFQFYLDSPIDMWVPYNTAADFVYTELARRTWHDIFVGISYVYTKFETQAGDIPETSATDLHGVGLQGSLDRRTSVYYPRGGFLSNVKYTTYPSAWNEFVSNMVELDYNHYFPVRRNQDVVAARAYAGLGIGEPSFNQQFVVNQPDIRGYTQGGYRGNYLLAVQGEYRWNFHRRLGLVGFLGFATLFESINKDDDGKILPGIGAGFRYTIVTDNHMNAGIDIAAGLDDWGIYFRIGEAF
jgi:hypothetical protein